MIGCNFTPWPVAETPVLDHKKPLDGQQPVCAFDVVSQVAINCSALRRRL